MRKAIVSTIFILLLFTVLLSGCAEEKAGDAGKQADDTGDQQDDSMQEQEQTFVAGENEAFDALEQELSETELSDEELEELLAQEG